MKRFFLITLLLQFCLCMAAQNLAGKKYGENEEYKRSSLCLILLHRQGAEFSEDIKSEFLNLPLPSRYNDLNIDVRVMDLSDISKVWGNVKEKHITKWLSDHQVAKQLISKWFNRDASGRMDMKRIQQWGDYNASYKDLMLAESSARNRAMLQDNGEELIHNTFVLVCDMTYYNREETKVALGAVFGALLGAGASIGAKAANMNQAQSQQMTNNMVTTGMLLGEATDIGGFAINMTSYLYRLQWNNSLRDKMYDEYWVDDTTPSEKVQQRVSAFNEDNSSFCLDYLGNYYAHAGKTVRYSQNNMHTVIRNVCADAVEESVAMLAKMYPVFRPTSTYTCDGDNLYAYIGTKEGITNKTRYEVVEREETPAGITYNRLATVRPVKDKIWNNKYTYIADHETTASTNGTAFEKTSKGLMPSKESSADICSNGLLLREAGTSPFNYKRNNQFYIGLQLASPIPMQDDDIKSNGSFIPSLGFDLSWIYNRSPRFAWNFANYEMFFLGLNGTSLFSIGGKNGKNSFIHMGYSAGIILRSNVLKSKYTLFLWPTVGYCLQWGEFNTSHPGYKTATWTHYGLDWRVKVGTYIGRKYMVSAFVGAHRYGLQAGIVL